MEQSATTQLMEWFLSFQVTRSLQSGSIQQIRGILNSYITGTRNQTHEDVYRGLPAVWDQLMLTSEENVISFTSSYLPFTDAFEMYLG